MNLPTILISLAVLGLYALAIRYMHRNGSCAGCTSCGTHNRLEQSGCSGCCNQCSFHCQSGSAKKE
ncbi:FeoB-associated Cys-rich membrane protein [Diplocloster modestus]|uniref:FeoB-associated Cys-rich membrane protein n=1 Tax=Diplocloster modestus TaxID=2850322 RepID=A0ABS6K3M1_9FIRM|nr:FeoB-associated Cys-rich membrane protein [Diplocloster modestus]MBU9725081.1 FeoB-associated Cys-rich membrane protein [Diplocloster modestus]